MVVSSVSSIIPTIATWILSVHDREVAKPGHSAANRPLARVFLHLLGWSRATEERSLKPGLLGTRRAWSSLKTGVPLYTYYTYTISHIYIYAYLCACAVVIFWLAPVLKSLIFGFSTRAQIFPFFVRCACSYSLSSNVSWQYTTSLYVRESERGSVQIQLEPKKTINSSIDFTKIKVNPPKKNKNKKVGKGKQPHFLTLIPHRNHQNTGVPPIFGEHLQKELWFPSPESEAPGLLRFCWGLGQSAVRGSRRSRKADRGGTSEQLGWIAMTLHGKTRENHFHVNDAYQRAPNSIYTQIGDWSKLWLFSFSVSKPTWLPLGVTNNSFSPFGNKRFSHVASTLNTCKAPLSEGAGSSSQRLSAANRPVWVGPGLI